MSKKAVALVTGAVFAGVLAAGGWLGYQHLEAQAGNGSALRGFDAQNPAEVAPRSEDVFTGRVMAYEEQRDLETWTADIYRVDVVDVLRGDVKGTIRVTWAQDHGRTQRLTDGETYVFATQPWDAATVENGHSQMFKGEMKPVDDAQVTAWKKAAALSVRLEQ
ncbi:hypothetical protein [Streptomyces sp. NPDC056144]|uniref:hypothetical protein n=1 Tax=unclassified Streptomyces TaxID=2593676 RepID=UPI0035D85A68